MSSRGEGKRETSRSRDLVLLSLELILDSCAIGADEELKRAHSCI